MTRVTAVGVALLLVTGGCVRSALEPAGVSAECDRFRQMQIEQTRSEDMGAGPAHTVERLMGAQDNCDASKAK